MVTATYLPHGIKSLSELIEIENTTQTTLYVAFVIADRLSMALNV